MGEISTDNLISGDDLANMVGVKAGVPQNSSVPWLKFVLENQLLYVAKRPFRHSIRWEYLYQLGLVYGTDGSGDYPIGSPTNQKVIINIAGSPFLVRLMKGSNTDPTDQPDTISGDQNRNNEWDRLIPNIISGPNSWAKYTKEDLGIGLAGKGDSSWCQETSSKNYGFRVIRGGAGTPYGFHTRDGVDSGNSRGWRPVLQLIR